MTAGLLVIAAAVAAPAPADTTASSTRPAGQAAAAEPLPPDSAFDKVTIDRTSGEPIDLAVLPDNRVLHTTRDGQVRLHDPATRLTTLAARVPVYQHDEEGLQSVAIDPDFEDNGWVYLYYSPRLDTPADDPATPGINEGDAPLSGTAEDFAPFEGYIQLSRFQLAGDEIDLGSEEQIMRVPGTRGICCHVGGDIVFDDDGNLYLSTGDDSNPFESDGFVPIDERAERNPAYDAQRTAANTDDLRGKTLRITPTEGNMFAPGTAGTAPEIYLMGLRNPFRIELDRATDRLFIGDYSPDSRQDDPERGPQGIGRWMSVEEPANYGWPYCVSPTVAYVDYDFATDTSGEAFDCENPLNESPRNTGLTELPPVADSELAYTFSASAQFPELGTGGIGPMAGPVYHGDATIRRDRTDGRPPSPGPRPTPTSRSSTSGRATTPRRSPWTRPATRSRPSRTSSAAS